MSITSRVRPAAAGSHGTWRRLPVPKSISSACPRRAKAAIAWSIPPVGAPTMSFSARMHSLTIRSRRVSSRSRPATSQAAIATATSSEAELDSPAPRGTRPSTSRSRPGTVTWSPCRAHSTPATYAANPDTDEGVTSATRPAHVSSDCRLRTRDEVVGTPSGRHVAGVRQRDRQAPPAVVVEVLADQVDPARARRRRRPGPDRARRRRRPSVNRRSRRRIRVGLRRDGSARRPL